MSLPKCLGCGSANVVEVGGCRCAMCPPFECKDCGMEFYDDEPDEAT